MIPLDIHGKNFMVIFTTLSVVIWFSTGTGDFCHTCLCFYYACGNMWYTEYGNNSTLSTSRLFCNLCYILLWTTQCDSKLFNISVYINKPTRVIIFAMLVAVVASDDGYFSETIWQSHSHIYPQTPIVILSISGQREPHRYRPHK